MTPTQKLNRPLLVFAVATAVLALVSLYGIVADDRILLGVPIWAKPFKFAVSFTVYSLTLAWMLSVMPRRSRPALTAVGVILVAAVVELTIIVGQVVRGRASHFNQSTALDSTLFSIMGATIVVLWLANLVIAIVALRQRIPDRAAARAIQIGLALSLLGMLVAIPMTIPSSGMVLAADASGAHSIGVADGGPGMFLTGWSLTGGDLRIGHFIGLHGMQAIPLLALLLARFSGRLPGLTEGTRARLVTVAGVAYAVLTLMLTAQALRAQPLLQPDAITLAGFAVLAIGTVAATAAVLRMPAPAPQQLVAVR